MNCKQSSNFEMEAVSNRVVPGISEPEFSSSNELQIDSQVSLNLSSEEYDTGLPHEGIDVYCSPRIRRKRTTPEGAVGHQDDFDWLTTIDPGLGLQPSLQMIKCKSNQDINSEAFLKDRQNKAHSMLLLKNNDKLALHNSCCNLLIGRSDQKRLTPGLPVVRSGERDQSKSCNDLTKAFERSWGRNLRKSNCTSSVSLNSRPSSPGTLRSSKISLLSTNGESYDDLYNQAFNSTFVSGSTEQLVEETIQRNEFVRDWLEKTSDAETLIPEEQ